MVPKFDGRAREEERDSVDVNWIYLLPVKKARKRKLIRAKQKYIICCAIQLRQKSNPNAPPSLLFKSHTNTLAHTHVYTNTNTYTRIQIHRHIMNWHRREQLWTAFYNSCVLFTSCFELTSSETSNSSSRLPLPSNQCVGSEEHVDKV